MKNGLVKYTNNLITLYYNTSTIVTYFARPNLNHDIWQEQWDGITSLVVKIRHLFEAFIMCGKLPCLSIKTISFKDYP